MLLIGGLTVKNTGNALLKEATAEVTRPIETPAADGITGGPAILAAVRARRPEQLDRPLPLGGLQTLAEVLSKAFFFVLWIPALAGLVWFL